jgi:hypothetical protein
MPPANRQLTHGSIQSMMDTTSVDVLRRRLSGFFGTYVESLHLDSIDPAHHFNGWDLLRTGVDI